MASLQIPFSRWDWPNLEALIDENDDQNIERNSSNHINTENNHYNYHSSHNDSSSNYNSNSKNNNNHNHNHRSDISKKCSHPKSNPIAASSSSLSAMLLEGQAVLAHQTSNAIWLFIGLSNGAIWKWIINLVSWCSLRKLK